MILIFKLVHARDQVFHVNLAQIHSTVLEIFHAHQTKKTQTDSAKNRTFHSSLCVVVKHSSLTRLHKNNFIKLNNYTMQKQRSIQHKMPLLTITIAVIIYYNQFYYYYSNN